MDRLSSIYNKVIIALEEGLPHWLTYHNAEHTKYVLKQAEIISKHEGITGRDLDLVRIAALYHDTGFLKDRKNHETLSCNFASQDLRESLTEEETDKICGMIIATKIPQNPVNITQKIIADADLEYLGTENFFRFSRNLYQELLHYNPSLTLKEWDEIQIDFLTKHSYHTNYCKQTKEPIKKRNLEMVKERLLT
ncbi:HD domain-containing protein [Salegentibacter sp. JZCK2]|uniref:HD domain-containing protein n=1 Tax=Salegentibacter tibetensis TaxID=2873600 RepID=UPI001CCD0E3E|nr:HD domain-containing protein [Salegentibacter tibetensis]MBZ9730639.1 HD domain-containing protein [Salegentibacter tibetensis]